MTSRRSFMQNSALSLTALGLAGGPAIAGNFVGKGPRAGLAAFGTRRISVSESFVFPEWLAALDKAGATTADHALLQAWRTTTSDAINIDHSDPESLTLLSLPAPGVEMLGAEQARHLAKLANNRLAQAVARGGGRLAGLATLAAFDPGAADEAKRAITELGLAGLSLGANRGLRLDHPSLSPVFAYAAAAGVPIYLPASYAPSTGDAPYRAAGAQGVLAGAAQDSARHAAQLIYGGVLDAYPALRVVLARLGEGTPYWCTQLANTYTSLQRAGRPLPSRPALAYFSDNIMLTTADMASVDTMSACEAIIGHRRIVHCSAGRHDTAHSFATADSLITRPSPRASIRRGQALI